MAAKRRKYTKKTKGRMFIIFLLFGAVIFTLGYTFLNDLKNINILVKEKKELLKTKNKLEEKKESLEADIERLSDKEYIARYAREKYFYSKNGEFILRMDD